MNMLKNNFHLEVSVAAIYLGVSDSTVRRWIKQGKIESEMMLGQIMIPASEINRIVNGKEKNEN